MIRDRERYYAPLLFLLDSCAVAAAYLCCVLSYPRVLAALHRAFPYLRFVPHDFYWDSTLRLLPLVVIPFVFFTRFSVRTYTLQKNLAKDVVLQTIVPCLFAFIVFLCLLLVNPWFRSDVWFAFTFVVLLWLLLAANRFVLLSLMKLSLTRGRSGSLRQLLVVGTDPSSLKVAQLFDSRQEWGTRIVGLLSNKGAEVGKTIGGYPVLGSTDDLFSVIERHVVDCVLFAEEASNERDMQTLALRCPVVGVDFVLDVSAFVKKVSSVALELTREHSFIVFKPVWRKPEILFLKRLSDLALALIAVALCLPFWIVIPVLIKRDSPGPVFYVQERVGKNGRIFHMYKFRTMVEGAEKMQAEVMHLNEMDGPVFKIKNDPRLTRVGKLLRRTSLDELPQLFNVLNGTMSLVGPRPPILKEVLQYRPWQRKRLSVTPGVTCLWQVTGRNEIKFDEWMKLDMQYIENWSLTLDFKILLKTVTAVIERRGAL